MRNDRLHERDAPESITEQASSWWVLLNEAGATPADHSAFGDWVVQSPERVAAFLRTAQLAQGLRSPNLSWPNTSADDLLREAKAVEVAEVVSIRAARVDRPHRETSVAPFPARDGGRRGGGRRMRLGLKAALVGALATAAMFLVSVELHRTLRPTHFQTELGEQRSLVLGDGSVVTLNTSSAIEVKMTGQRRTIKLNSGEALFQVAHDANRPFDVIVANTTVRAVGTEFNVDRRTGSTTVTVIDGRVVLNDTTLPSVSGTLLNSGQEAVVTPRSVTRRDRANPATAIAWTQRKLVFEHQMLGAVADEFNRYNRRTVLIESDELREQEVTGVFRANDLDSFVMFLGHLPGVTVQLSADGTRYTVATTSHSAGFSVP